MTEQQQKTVVNAKKSYTRGLLTIEEVKNCLEANGIPEEEIGKIVTELQAD